MQMLLTYILFQSFIYIYIWVLGIMRDAKDTEMNEMPSLVVKAFTAQGEWQD